MGAKTLIKCVNRDRARRAGYKFKMAKLENEDFIFTYAERGFPPSLDKDQPSVLFLHGLTSSKDTFYALSRRFPSTLHCVALDLPGHCGTTFKENDDLTNEGVVKRVHQFVKTIKLNRVRGGIHLIGHSWGAILAAIYAIKYGPEGHVRFLSLLCPTLWTPEHTEIFNRVATENISTFTTLATPDTPKGLFSWHKTIYYKCPKWKYPKWFWKAVLALKKSEYESYRKYWNNVGPELICERWTHRNLGLWKMFIKTPMHIIWGKNDMIFHVSGASMMADSLQCRLDELKESGHMTPMELPKKVADIIMDFRKECVEEKLWENKI